MSGDFKRVAAELLRRAYDIVPRWLPSGRADGHEFKALNPTRADSELGSFSVNLQTGLWGDFAGTPGTDTGHDLVALYAYIHNVRQIDALRACAVELGIDIENSAPSAPAGGGSRAPAPQPRARTRKADDVPGVLQRPAPPDAPSFDHVLVHRTLGRAVLHWQYRDAAGALLLVIARWNITDEKGEPAKRIRQFTCWRLTEDWRGHRAGELVWAPKWIDHPRPLYNLDQLAKRPRDRVLVVEGEKAADAAAVLFPDYVVTTSPGGVENAKLADWSPLGGRTVVIWGDADLAKRRRDPHGMELPGWKQAGMAYVRAVAIAAQAAKATSVGMIDYRYLAQVRKGVLDGRA